jgi:HPt (histidine-containing phosphotransfer) domain-containing protein
VEEADLLAAMRRAVGLRAGSGPGQGQAPATAPAGPGDPALVPRFDPGFLKRSFDDRSDLLADMLAQFHTLSLPEIEGNLRQALAAKDMPRVQQVAHKARGTFGTVGARRAALLAQAVEKATANADAEGLLLRYAEALLAETAALDEHLRQNRPWPELAPEPASDRGNDEDKT